MDSFNPTTKTQAALTSALQAASAAGNPEIRPAVPKVRQEDRGDPHQRTIPCRGDGCIVPDSPGSTGSAKRLHSLADPKDLSLGEFLREQLS